MSFDHPGEVRLRWDGWMRSEGKIKKVISSEGRGRVLLLGVI